MLSKANIKYIKSLQVKKYRKQEQCFVVEGAKSVQELLASDFEVVKVFGTAKFLETQDQKAKIPTTEVREDELSSLGEFQTNNAALAVARMRPNSSFTVSTEEFAIVLDDIKDPGNLGTIIRTADWYGINKIIASPETADFYSPKVISASMGSFCRTQIFYTILPEYLRNVKQKIYGAFLEGENVHKTVFGKGGLIVIGSESHGIGDDVGRFITDKITIPRFGKAESLNAAIATGIICDNVRRRD
jgi:RNA methyltransferase, TrmH family